MGSYLGKAGLRSGHVEDPAILDGSSLKGKAR